MTLLHLAGLTLLAAIWGASFLFISMSVSDYGPFGLMEVRVLLGGLMLWALAAVIRRRADWLPRWKQYAVLGGLNAAVPFTLIAAAELAIPASLAAILNALTPVFTAIVSAVWLGQRITTKLALGLLVSFAGVVVSVGWSPIELTLWPLLGCGAIAIASLFYALGSNYSSRTFHGVAPLTMSIGQNLGAAIVLAPFALATIPRQLPSITATGAMLGLTVICTAVAYLIYFWLLNSVGPTRTTSVTFLVPLFGMIWGRLFLGEELTPGMFAGLALVFSGIVLVADLKPRPKPALGATPAPGGNAHPSGQATPGSEPAAGASPTSAAAPAAGATAACAEQEAAATACGGCE